MNFSRIFIAYMIVPAIVVALRPLL